MVNALMLNTRLKVWKIIPSDVCTHCGEKAETIQHFFWECCKAKELWKAVKQICKRIKANDSLEINLYTVITNLVNPNSSHVYNFVCIVAKYYLYVKRCLKQDISIEEFQGLIFKYQRYEKYYALRNNQFHKFCKKWALNIDNENSQLDESTNLELYK